ncbi:MAG: ADP-ribosylglycohydrolase family protein [Gammaproteobacteria bacterium]|nr:ADP-ribosylglycohydrolase family protein [Gammaproteobacteria bacterium]
MQLVDSLEKQLIRMELVQRREEGCDVTAIESRVQEALADDATDDAVFVELYDALDALAPATTFPYEEPSELEAIRALRPDGPRRMYLGDAEDAVGERIHGAWLGRAAGCSLGKPVEGWPRKRIDDYLESAGALPLDDYIPYTEGAISPRLKSSTRDNIEFMARDDDMDYPILGLLALEQHGTDLTSRHMANTWLGRMPFHLLYTAESVAYRNFVNRLWPPESAVWRNPYREWIGAQIRADIFGYVAPGWPEKAAELAYRDASISHVKNGIYGEMFVAAMLAAAFVESDIEKIVHIGLSEIPRKCRLAEAARDTLAWCRELSDWEEVWEKIHEKYGHYHGVHAINNAALVVMGLYFGANDFEKGIVVTVRGGWDTDCTGATVGSILGVKFGAGALPDKWVGVLNDRLMSCVRDCNDNRISELAERTHRVASAILAPAEEEDESEPIGDGDGGLPGTWKMDLEWGDLILKVDEDLSGRIEMKAFGETRKIRNVRIEGNKVRFAFGMPKGEVDMDIEFEGTVRGDRLKGTCSGGGFEFALNGVRI